MDEYKTQTQISLNETTEFLSNVHQDIEKFMKSFQKLKDENEIKFKSLSEVATKMVDNID